MTNGTTTICIELPVFEMVAAVQNMAKCRWRSDENVRGTLRAVAVVAWPVSTIAPAATSAAGSLGLPTTNSSSASVCSVVISGLRPPRGEEISVANLLDTACWALVEATYHRRRVRVGPGPQGG